jgi:hypothetical protein
MYNHTAYVIPFDNGIFKIFRQSTLNGGLYETTMF